MNWLKILELIMYVLGKIKDTDGDGRTDLFDSDPTDPSKK